METEFKVQHFAIEQLKEEIRQKDHQLITAKFDEHKLAKGNEAIAESLDKGLRPRNKQRM